MGRHRGWMLWVLALLVMLSAARFQRTTGPSYPLHGEAVVGATTLDYGLVRTGTTDRSAEVVIPAIDEIETATIQWRRYPTDEDFAPIAMEHVGAEWRGPLPIQPSAGKLEYRVSLTTVEGNLLLPPAADEAPVLRYKDPVPIFILLPHILMMFLSMWIGVRAGFAAVSGERMLRVLVPIALVGMSIGGMILGPIVQKHAFGAYWTGWPNGYDLTDNKMLIMWLVWLLAFAAFRWRPARLGRAAVIAATLVMLGVYVVPHSLRGSELDYEALDDVDRAHEAIRTGKSGGEQ